MLCHTENGEFYLLVRGYELRELPDIPVVCHPLIHTSTHELAIQTNPRWCLNVRHRGSWKTKTRPKVRIYPEDNSTVSLSFALHSQERFESVKQVLDALRKVDFTLKPSDIHLGVVKKDSELSKAHAAGYTIGKEEGAYEARLALKDPGVLRQTA